MEYFLGLDWGKRKCGTALADKETQLAFAGKIIETQNFEKELAELRKKFSFSQIILGISETYLFSSKNKEAVLQFKKKLEKKGFRVHVQEEFFSTKLARSNLREKAGEKKTTKKADDAEAARLILQSWLDKKREEC